MPPASSSPVSPRNLQQMQDQLQQMQDQLQRQVELMARLAEQAAPPQPRAARRTPPKPKPAAQRRRGRPSLAERPHQFVGRPPFPEYATWSITATDPQRNSRVQVQSMTDPQLVRRTLQFEQRQPKPRATMVGLLSRRLQALTKPPAPAPAPAKAKAPQLPFPGYERVASSRRPESKRLIAAQSDAQLHAALRFERAERNRVQVLAMLQHELDRRQAAAPPVPVKAQAKAQAPAAKRRRGRPTLAERPHQFVGRPPFPEYATWSITATDPQRNSRVQILAMSDPQLVRRTLQFEQRQPKPRATMVGLLTRRLRALTGAGATGGRRPAPAPETLPFPGYARVASSRQTESRALLAGQSLETLEACLDFERTHQQRVQVVDMIEQQLKRRRQQGLALPFPEYAQVSSSNHARSKQVLRRCTPEQLRAARTYEQQTRQRVQVLRLIEAAQQPARPRSAAPGVALEALPFPEYAQVASSRLTRSRSILLKRSLPELEAALAFERATQRRSKVLQMEERLIRRKRREAEPAKAPAKAPEVLPFPGYAQVASSKLTESRALLVGQSLETLEACLAFERTHQQRSKVLALLERLIRQQQSGRVRGSRLAVAGAPLADYDALPAEVVVRSINHGAVDDKLSAILAYERAHGGRASVLQAAEARLSAPRGQVVSPAGRVWKGREPWLGYGSLNHNDRQVLYTAFTARSNSELRRVPASEARQDFPSREAVETVEQVLAERQRQTVTA